MPTRIDFKEDWFPVAAFFNSLWDDGFVEKMESLARGVGISMDVCHCDFPGDNDPEEEPFEGVKFSIYEDEAILTWTEFIHVINKVCDVQKERRPEQADGIDAVLKQIKTE